MALPVAPDPDAAAVPSNGTRERRSRRDASALDSRATEQSALGAAESSDSATSNGDENSDQASRRGAHRTGRHRPRAPRAERGAAPATGDSIVQDQPAGDSLAEPSATAAAEALVINLSGKKPDRGARTLKRARRKQQDAATALEAAEDNPALGALNRHLNMMMQQLGTAHRVIGRVAAERDALRQQLADLQGIPVEEIVVTTIGASSDQPASASRPEEPQPKTGLSRLNYFGGEDVAVMRKRRQTFVLGLLVFVIVLWWAGRMGAWQMPDNLSRDSLSGLPYVGDFMTYFLAGWLFFRVIKVSSKGVKWVFPNDDQRRRRR